MGIKASTVISKSNIMSDITAQTENRLTSSCTLHRKYTEIDMKTIQIQFYKNKCDKTLKV